MIAFQASSEDTTLDPDTECMIRVAAGDRGAFDQLVRGNFPSTVRIIAAMMGSHSQAEDLAQEVFFRIYRSRERYVPTAKFSTWLGTIIRNVVLNAKRSLSRRRDRPTQFADEMPYQTHEGGPTPAPSYECDLSSRMERQETALAVEHAIRQLPVRQQQAIQLVHMQGMDYATAAASMDTTRQAIKSLLGRGRGTLGVTLRDEYTRRFGIDQL